VLSLDLEVDVARPARPPRWKREVRTVADGEARTGLPAVDGEAKDHLRFEGVVDLHAGFGAGMVREQEQQAAVQGLGVARGGEDGGDGLSSEGRKGE
jgi:hypothetical protein